MNAPGLLPGLVVKEICSPADLDAAVVPTLLAATRVRAWVVAGAKRPCHTSEVAIPGRFADYYPAWVDKPADDVTLEGSMLDGDVQGADAIRAVIGGVRALHDRQDFNFAGPRGDNSLIEDYTAEVRGRPLGCLHLVTFDADGQTQHIAAGLIPQARVKIYPDAAHRFLFQHHADFTRDVDAFLTE